MKLNKKILFVDDDSDFLEVNQLMLIDEGYDVIPAKNGTEAVEKYKETNPDIVFLDIKMPGINGYETFFRIIKFDPDARIIFTSSYALSNDEFKRAKDTSLIGILNKPFEFNDIQSMIKQHSK